MKYTIFVIFFYSVNNRLAVWLWVISMKRQIQLVVISIEMVRDATKLANNVPQWMHGCTGTKGLGRGLSPAVPHKTRWACEEAMVIHHYTVKPMFCWRGRHGEPIQCVSWSAFLVDCVKGRIRMRQNVSGCSKKSSSVALNVISFHYRCEPFGHDFFSTESLK